MLGEISPATLDLWVKTITNYAARYGPEVWALIYQTDVRARLEHMERVRRIGISEMVHAIGVGAQHPLDPKRPWEWVFRRTVDDMQFWRRELEEPAPLNKTRVDKLNAALDDDAPLGQGPSVRTRPALPAPPRKQPKTSNERADRPREHSTDAEGYFTANRRGINLCAAYQKGDCVSKDGSHRCPKDSSSVHQCSKCLLTGHGRHQCQAHEFRQPPRHKGGKGKGRGKGRRHD